jgi:SAM-dependent methyltransferase
MAHALATFLRMVDRPTVESPPLQAVIDRLAPHWHSDWAWDSYKPTVMTLARDLRLTRLCEIGGGRDPLLTADEVSSLRAALTINDISQRELDRAPGGFATACFDVAGDLTAAGIGGGRYDLMFSRMVFEHIADVAQAWRNIHTLLAPGGVALAFFPTLYALPFLMNHIMPERLSSGLLKRVYPERADDGGDPKFPAVYDRCFGDDTSHRTLLEAIGFREVAVLPFWGHRYFKRLPGLREVDAGFNALAARLNWRAMTTYAYVIVRK